MPDSDEEGNIGALELVAFDDFQEFFIIVFSYLILLSLVDLLKYCELQPAENLEE